MNGLVCAGLSGSLVIASALTTEATTSGRIAVFRDNVPVVGTASQPDYLAKTLRDAGFSVTMLSAADL
ncbi:MAG: hypothetical protein FJ279_34040, partial [Planctomycetes bacterium]|nr:hypothetical protein [Planctomycetota bacterium]